MPHLDDYDLIRYARLDETGRRDLPAIGQHLAECPECAEELAIVSEWLDAESADAAAAPSPSLLSELVYRLAVRSTRRIDLTPFAALPAPSTYALAADGGEPPGAGWQHRATLYSEDPEVILRIMHDPQGHRDFLQLTGADPSLTRNVRVHLADTPTDFFTDDRGIAEIGAPMPDDPSGLHWQIRLPDATFALSPLELAARLRAAETVLEAEGGHRLAAAIVDEGDSVSLRIRPLSIFGQTAFAKVRVVVSQAGGRWRLGEAATAQDTITTQVTTDEPIEIRLFLT